MLELFFASTILIIGDSHSVGPFGWHLDEELRKAGHQVATYASCGSIAKWWTNSQKTTCGYYSNDLKNNITRATTHPTPKLSELLETIRPTSVIVELGSNYVKTPGDDFVRDDLKRMVQMIKDSGAQCFWISAPDMRLYRDALPRLDKLVQEAVGDYCEIFDSKTVTAYPATGGDGVHYWFKEGMPIARKWADGFVENFARTGL